MSLHDAMFGAHGVPTLMDHFSDCESVTVVLGDETIVDEVDAILRPKQGFDEVLPDGTEVKRLAMEVDLLVDEDEVIGLKEDFTKAHVIVDDEAWSIQQIDSWTANMQRLQLVRKVPHSKTRSGFRRT